MSLGRIMQPVTGEPATLSRTVSTPLLIRVGMLVGAFAALEFALFRVSNLPQESYQSPVLILEVAARVMSALPGWAVAAAALVAAPALFLLRRELAMRWEHLPGGEQLRVLAVIIATGLSWAGATYEYNLYFDRAHGTDRLLVIALLLLAWWRPVFLLPLLLVLLPLLWQFGYPIGGFSRAGSVLPVRVLILVGAFWLLRAVTKRGRTDDAVFVLCCIIAAHYWASGYAKLQLEWPAHARPALLLPATYSTGWLAFLQPETIAAIARALLWLNLPMKIGVLLVECGAVVALYRRKSIRAFLAASIGLHAGIFLISGIFFWQWMLVNAAVLVLFFGTRGTAPSIFTRQHLVASMALIVSSGMWLWPPVLAWIDSPVTYTYRAEAVGASGRVYELPPRFFAPYDYQFTLGAFGYLVAAPRLSIVWGAAPDWRLVERLAQVTSAADIEAVEARAGRRLFDASRSAAFDAFVGRFMRAWNREHGHTRWWMVLRPPPLLWSFPRRTTPAPGDALTRVVVYEVTTLFDGRRYHEVRTLPIRSIDVQPLIVPPRS
jgi:hypothetical protein